MPTASVVHQANLVHRDIKVPNIWVIDDVPLLIDFGLVWQFDDAEDRPTDTNEAIGNRFSSHDYQRTFIDEPPPWVDVFSLVNVFQALVCVPVLKSNWARPLHWKYLSYPPESTEAFVNGIRSLGAISSLESTCPKDGAALCEAMDELFSPPRSTGAVHELPQEVFDRAQRSKIAESLTKVHELEEIEVDREVARRHIDSIISVLRAWGNAEGAIFEQKADFEDWVNSFDHGRRDGDLILAELACSPDSVRTVRIDLMVQSLPASRWGKKGHEAPKWHGAVNTFSIKLETHSLGGRQSMPARYVRLTIDRKNCSLQLRDETYQIVEDPWFDVSKLENILRDQIEDPDIWDELFR